MSPDWAQKAEPVPYAKLDNPQSLNLYAYVGNNPLRGTDPDGHDPDTGEQANISKGGGASPLTDTVKSRRNSSQQQNGSLGGGGFWHHVSNLFHGHSWNYAEVNVVQGDGEVREPNVGATLGADAANLASATPGVIPGAPGLMLGLGAAGVSSVNDSSGLNLSINATGSTLGVVSLAAEGTAVGTGAAVGGFGVAFGAATWDLDNAFVNHVLSPMFNAAPTETINVNGETIPNPALSEVPYDNR